MQPANAGIVDWFSFSVLTDEPEDGEPHVDTVVRVKRAAQHVLDIMPDLAPSHHEAQHGRKPYKWASGTSSRRFLYSSGQAHVTVELSGVGCQELRERGLLSEILEIGAGRATRLDLAVDIKSQESPFAFVSAGYNHRITSMQHITSETGETVVLGSPKSDRYARVYRYDPPHPRAKYLRIEMVHRSELARQYARDVIDNGIRSACRHAGAAYEWQHGLWDMPIDERPKDWRVETKQGGTVRWFYRAVVPAVQKLIVSQALTPSEVLSALGFTLADSQENTK